MIRLQTYTGFSVLAILVAIYHAFHSRGQFYPAMVYLSTSKINLVLLLNMGLVIMCVMWQLTKKVFLGSLREAEVERLNEQSWREVMEILFAITIFRRDFSVSFLAMVTALLLIKALHWLAQKRVEYIETTPSVPKLSHARIVSFMGFLLLLDCLFLYNSVKFLIETRQASVSFFFAFEYMILATTTISTFMKYVFYVSDMLMDGQWERKAVYTFYLELVRDLLHLSMYLCFFLVIFMNYGVPLHLIRELYETFRNFKIRVADYIRYRKITSNMNDRFPDATPEELTLSDATCIICREEMTTAKKLVCGHLFHVHCLRSWLERQQTCPTCRALVVPSENGSTPAGSHAGSHQQGTSANTSSASSSQGSSGDGGATTAISLQQARLQAAASAASVYEKSYVYPSANTLVWGSGYTILPQGGFTPGNSVEEVLAGQSENNHSPMGPANMTFPLMFPGINMNDAASNYLGMADKLLEAQKKTLQYQIEALQRHLKLVEEAELQSEVGSDPSTLSDSNQGKRVVGSSAPDCVGHEEDSREV